MRQNFESFIVDKDILNGLFANNGKTLLHQKVFNSFETTKDKIGFAAQYYTQKLYDKILADAKSRMIAAEIDKLVNAITD